MKNLSRNVFSALVVVLLGALLYFTVFSDGLGKAPEVLVKTADNQALNLSYPKKPVLVNFWATSCPGCIEKMPELASMKQRLGDRFTLVAVSMNYDPVEQVQNFINKNQYPFDFVMDTDNQIAEAFGGVLLTPTSFLIAPNGNIVYQKIGDVDMPMLETRIKQLSPQI